MVVARKTKRTLSRVVVTVVALLRPLFLYQNAAVLYLNVNKEIMVILVKQAENLPSTKQGACCPSLEILLHQNHHDFAQQDRTSLCK